MLIKEQFVKKSDGAWVGLCLKVLFIWIIVIMHTSDAVINSDFKV